jgi:6-pyruvoyl-tetrahydropterin synthase related domain
MALDGPLTPGKTPSRFVLRMPAVWTSDAARARALSTLAAVAIMGTMLAVALAPFFRDLNSFGFHDWDSHMAYRYVTVLCLKYFEGPWWDPWISGGYPAWGYVEGATNFVSPYLPAYLLLPVQVAVRLEVLGSAIAGLAGTYLLAGRFTRSAAVRTLVAVLFALNGRWALQATAGHTWHLRYSLMPWVFYLFDVALETKKPKHAVRAGMVLALMIYMGGIYPAPHTAIFLSIYALVYAALTKRSWPVVALAIAGAVSVGFSAPKVLPVIDTMTRTPRTINSPEAIGLRELATMMTEHEQPFYGKPVPVPIHGWHEYGLYIGWAGVLALLVGLLFASGPRGYALKIAGMLALLLGLGSFHPKAPWSLLHQLPLFASQWVPSRYLYPAVLLLSLSCAVSLGRFFDRVITKRPWFDLVALVPVLLVALDIAAVDANTMDITFHLVKPELPAPSKDFHQERRSPYQYKNPDPHAESVLLAMFANVGVVEAYGTPLFEGGSAIPRGSPEYKGEVHVEEGAGQATLAKWTPNSAAVDVSGASPGAMVVYNMNWDPSWRANGQPAVAWHNLVAAPAPSGSGRVKFTYYPRRLNVGLLACALTALVCFGGPLRKKLREMGWINARLLARRG